VSTASPQSQTGSHTKRYDDPTKSLSELRRPESIIVRERLAIQEWNSIIKLRYRKGR
jgi:hypothetical protein